MPPATGMVLSTSIRTGGRSAPSASPATPASASTARQAKLRGVSTSSSGSSTWKVVLIDASSAGVRVTVSGLSTAMNTVDNSWYPSALASPTPRWRFTFPCARPENDSVNSGTAGDISQSPPQAGQSPPRRASHRAAPGQCPLPARLPLQPGQIRRPRSNTHEGFCGAGQMRRR